MSTHTEANSIFTHMEKINPEKYIELAAKVQQEAKEAAIALLRDKVKGHCIDPDFSTFNGRDDDPAGYWLFCFEGNDEHIQLHAYGLNEEGELCFKAWYPNSDAEYKDGQWCEFESHFISDKYHLVYEIIADHVLGNI